MSESKREKRATFSSKRSLLALRCPPGRKGIEYFHESIRGFGVRIMKPRADGQVRKTYIRRFSTLQPDGRGGFKKHDDYDNLGLVEPIDDEPAISYDEAQERALAGKRVQRESKKEGSDQRMTVGAAWQLYTTEKSLNRPATLKKDRGTYERNLAHLASKYLDELPYKFWSGFDSQLAAGTLQVGTVLRDGEEVPDLRGPLAATSRLAVLNVASNLYEIAHMYEGIKQLKYKENPARDAKRRVGAVNKRKTLIPLKHVGKAWRASKQLVNPTFRDAFQVCVLTGLRRSLLLSMKFSEIDFRTGIYMIDPRTPGTKRRGKDIPENPEPIRLPLSRPVLEIIKNRREFAPDPDGHVWYSNPGRGAKASGGVITDPRSSWTGIEEHIGVHFTMHDLRRTFATVGIVAADVTDVFALSLLMLHSGSSLAEAVGLPAITVDYINTAEAQGKMRAATDAVAAYVLGLANGTIQAPEHEPELAPLLEAAAEAD